VAVPLRNCKKIVKLSISYQISINFLNNKTQRRNNT